MSVAEERKSGRFIDVSLDRLTKLGLIAGGVFALVQYLDARHDARVERPTSYIMRFEDGQAAVARRAINGTLRGYLSQFDGLEGETIDAQTRADMVMSVVEAEAGLADNIDMVVDFYEGLATCVREGLCASDVAHRYFAADAREFWNNFEPYVATRRINNADFAVGLATFAGVVHDAPNSPNVAQ